MSTKRDLVEAHSFSRRRLVTAFVSGAPGGREVEPNRPGRMVVGGLGLAVLVVAGGAVMGVVKPRTPDNWLEENGLVIVKESGARYMVVDGELHLAANTTSAQLYFGGQTNVRQVPQAEIDEQEIGGPLGIYGAPDSPPGPGRLVGTGWSACADGGEATVYVDDQLHVDEAAPDAAAVVTAGGATWLLAAREGETLRRYEITDAREQSVMNDLGMPYYDTVPVPAAWLDLVPAGEPLGSGTMGSARGTRLVTDSGTTYLLDGGRSVVLNDFSLAVYQALDGASENALEGTPTPDVEDSPATWPRTKLDLVGAGQLCLALQAEPGEAARVSLATADDESPALAQSSPVDLGPGVGAYVRSADFGVASGGQQFLIDSSGTRYKLGGEGTTSAEALGYDPDDAPTLPAPWLEMFGCGPELSRLAAEKPPNPESTTSCAGS